MMSTPSDTRHHRRFVVTFLCVAAAWASSVLALNIVVDPHAVCNTGLLPPIRMNSRRDKIEFFDKSRETADVLIMGSSRAFELDPTEVERRTGCKVFNAAVASCRAEDFLLILHHAIDVGRPPKTIILGIDVEGFHSTLPVDERWRQACPTVTSLIPELRESRWNAVLRTTTDLLSFHMTDLSIQSLRRSLREGVVPLSVFHEDGSITYPRYRKAIEEGTFDLDQEVARSIPMYRNRMAGFSALAEWRMRYFEDFLRLCRQHEIRLVAFMTTLHPDLSADLTATTEYDQRRAELLPYLRRTSEAFAFDLYDLEDPLHYGGTVRGFRDGAHITKENAEPLLEYLVTRSRSAFPECQHELRRQSTTDEAPGA